MDLDDEQNAILNSIVQKYNPTVEPIIAGGVAGAISYELLRKRPKQMMPAVVTAGVTSLFAFNVTRGLVLMSNIKTAVHDGSFEQTFPDGPAKSLILQKIKGGQVSDEQWTQYRDHKNQQIQESVAAIKSQGDNSRAYTSYSQLASQNNPSQYVETSNMESQIIEEVLQQPTQNRLEEQSTDQAFHRYSDLYNHNEQAKQVAGNRIAERANEQDPSYIKKRSYVNKYGDEVDVD